MNYVVKPGETLFDIACMFNTTVEELCMLNPQITDPMCLFPGQVICVPSQPYPMHPQMPMEGHMMASGHPCPVLRQGSQGPSVVHLQQLLTSHGFSPGAIDGIFGPRTEAAVIAFQQSRGLLVDGIVGVQTWTALGVNCMTPPPTQPCPTLRQGARGPDVVRLQQLLTSHGFSPGAIDGIFGPKTEAAVRAFQQSKGLAVDGIVGIQTWTALGVKCTTPPPPPPTQPCPTLRMGSRGAAVKELQSLLTAQGFSPGAIDGIFGSKTQAAVINFQKSKGLVQDGIVGIRTWTALGVNCSR